MIKSMVTELKEERISKKSIVFIFILYWILEGLSQLLITFLQIIPPFVLALRAEPDLTSDQFLAEMTDPLPFPWYGNLIKLGVICLILYLFKRQKVDFFQKYFFNARQWFTIIGLSVTCVLVNGLVSGIIMQLEPQFDTLNQVNLENMARSSMPLTIFIMMVVLAPIAEEVVIRGVFIGVLFKEKPYLGLIISSVLFALLHSPADFLSFVIYLIPGLTLGLIYIKTKWLGTPIIGHALNNFLAFLMIYL